MEEAVAVPEAAAVAAWAMTNSCFVDAPIGALAELLPAPS